MNDETKNAYMRDFLGLLQKKEPDSPDWPSFYNHILHCVLSLSANAPPVSQMQFLPIHRIKNNQYNPNKMATPERKLLLTSLRKDGMTMPIVVNPGHDGEYILIDGYHRFELIKANPELQQSKGYIPAVILNKLTLEERIASSVRHNLARGSHQVALSANMVTRLDSWEQSRICTELGMDKDELLRLSQVSGQAVSFKDDAFSLAWE